MSLFLGKIHYWLFNKILWFEGLEKEVILVAKNQGINVEKLLNEITEKYGEPTPNLKLEEMIDTSNIHGWLNQKINSAEGRMAALITNLIKDNNDIASKIEEVYAEQGIKAAKEVKDEGMEIKTALDIFNSVNDYILDGMPCDRVNEVIVSEDSIVQWKRRLCVHSSIWNEEQGDVNYFYKLRGLWITAFVNELNSNYEYIEKDEVTKVISLKK